MTTYTLRFLVPSTGPTASIDSTGTPEEVVSDFMAENFSKALLLPVGLYSNKEAMYAAAIEIASDDDSQVLVARHFYAGIGRQGGVVRPNPNRCSSLLDMATRLGVSEDFFNGTWYLEEPTT